MIFIRLCLTLILSVSLFVCYGQNGAFEAIYTYKTYGDYRPAYKLHYSNGVAVYHHNEAGHQYNTDDGITLHYPRDSYEWYHKISTNEIVELRLLQKNLTAIADHPGDFTWTIVDEFAEVAGYPVQKAVATKKYKLPHGPYWLDYVIAWFATDVPVSTGPERYYGLPGLIVKIEYSNYRGVNCTLTDLKWLDEKDLTVCLPEGSPSYLRVTPEEIISPNGIDKKTIKQHLQEIKKSRSDER